MVKGYDLKWGEYECFPCFIQEEGREYYLSQDSWTFDELCFLICGVDRHMSAPDPLEKIKWEEAESKIRRAVASRVLESILMFDEIYFIPKVATMWAEPQIKDFPFTVKDFGSKDISKDKAIESVGDRKVHNLYKIIGILSLQLKKKQLGGERSVGELYHDFEKVMEGLEEICCVDKYGLGKKSFYDVLKRAKSHIRGQ